MNVGKSTQTQTQRSSGRSCKTRIKPIVAQKNGRIELRAPAFPSTQKRSIRREDEMERFLFNKVDQTKPQPFEERHFESISLSLSKKGASEA
ncbi:hypothetical protein CDO73_21075 [Saccharibacillus sp. O23]|nr:hypothetical protein CDO73_21075 [Saccharibacillus sp. O23]